MQTPSKPKKGRKGKAKEPVLSPQETLDVRKDALLREKRAEGNAIANKHEDLVSQPALIPFVGVDELATLRAAP